MPNWCNTSYVFEGKKEKIAGLHKKLQSLRELPKPLVENDFIPYALVMNGEWHGRGDMGWWGISSSELPQKESQNKVLEIVKTLPDDTLISLYDCHI